MPVEVSFPDTSYSNLTIEEGKCLANCLDVLNSPVLFGCRSGICGTCIVGIRPTREGSLLEPEEDEVEILSLYAEGHSDARCACLLSPTVNIEIRKIEL